MFAVTAEQVKRDLNRISDVLNVSSGKMTKDEQLDLFFADETLTEEARLTAGIAVERAFSGLRAGSYEFTHGAVANVQVALARLGRAA